MIAPSKHQIIVNPNNGKRERIFVNLEAVYPTPEEPGTELSFEELWAASRGWLDAQWDDDSEMEEAYDSMPHDENEPPVVQQITHKVEKLAIMRDDSQENQAPRPKVEKLSIMRDDPQENQAPRPKVEKLMIFDDSQENQAPQQQPKASKPRRKKGMEVNETQISKLLHSGPYTALTLEAHH